MGRRVEELPERANTHALFLFVHCDIGTGPFCVVKRGVNLSKPVTYREQSSKVPQARLGTTFGVNTRGDRRGEQSCTSHTHGFSTVEYSSLIAELVSNTFLGVPRAVVDSCLTYCDTWCSLVRYSLFQGRRNSKPNINNRLRRRMLTTHNGKQKWGLCLHMPWRMRRTRSPVSSCLLLLSFPRTVLTKQCV